MGSRRMSDGVLAEMEEVCRESGFNYPIAWALGFLVDNAEVIRLALFDAGKEELLKTYNRLVKEIVTGRPQ